MKILGKIVYWIVRGLTKIVAHVIFPARVNGKKFTKIKEPYILCPNHSSLMDPVILVGAVLSRKAYFMGKAELYETKLGNWFYRSLLSFPVVRGTADMSAIRTSIKLLHEGYVMTIFPEGTRNTKKDGQIMEFYNGVGIVALNTKCKIIPCYIDSVGGYKLFRRFDINIGEPIDIKDFEADGIKKENLNKIMKVLKDRFGALM
jgi:1-acyl-sn-glycerol-3-phosphate acyltransferase